MFFPMGKTNALHGKITSFQQQHDESVPEAWERFQDYIQEYPHHGMERWLLMQTFYHGLDNSARETMDAAAGGAFLSLTIPQAIALVEKMTSNQGWNEERTQTCKRGGGMHCGCINPYTLMGLYVPHHQRWLGPQDEDVRRTTGRRAPQGYKLLYQIGYFACNFVPSGYIRWGRGPLEDRSHTLFSIQYNQTQDVGITPTRRPNLDKKLVRVLRHYRVRSLRTVCR